MIIRLHGSKGRLLKVFRGVTAAEKARDALRKAGKFSYLHYVISTRSKENVYGTTEK